MNEWNLVYDGFDPDREGLREALCTLGNGFFATRGAAPESAANAVHYPGTYLAGGYNRLETEIAGRVVENEDLVNLPNWLAVTFRIDGGDWFDLRKVELLSYRQELNMREGRLTRTVRFRDAKGRRTTIIQRRFVHMAHPHLAALETSWLPENWSGRYAFGPEMIHRNVDYYLRRTSNGSTLSQVVSSWVLARSDRARSWELFTQALRSDVADVQGGTTSEGIHLGAMAGTVDVVQRCYLGIEPRQGVLWLNPRLPKELTRLRLRIRYRQASLCLDATHERLKVDVIHCPIEPIRIGLVDRVVDLKEDEHVELNLLTPQASR